ncbi:MAG: hypothetical protein PHQ27_07555 [Victivallales bacterium]|nr:hypothetical protein [Victivallales bacterium]
MPERNSFAADFYLACARGFDRLAAKARTIMREAVTASQADDGLFAGRGRTGDLYYTWFGLLLAAVTDAKINLEGCLEAHAAIDVKSLDLVHGCAWLRINNSLKLLTLPCLCRCHAVKHISPPAEEKSRRMVRSLAALPDEAYPQSDPFSPYSRFLVNTLHGDFGMDAPDADLSLYRLESGLYANLKGNPEYGVNATASALMVISAPEAEPTAGALLELQQEDGSFKAVEKAPCGDLLSTGTAFFALNQYNMTPKISVKPFLRSCFRANGLFAATPDDPAGDLEYTVYALLALGGNA